jgi:hypothetical protein
MGAVFPILGKGCSKEASEENTYKRPGERLARVSPFFDKVSPTHFGKVILTPGLDFLLNLDGLCPYLGSTPRTITLKMKIGCNLMVRLGYTISGLPWTKDGQGFP